jgi:nucleoside phosphorylase
MGIFEQLIRAVTGPYRRAEVTPGRKGVATIGVLTVIKEEFDEISPILEATENVPGTQYFVRPREDPRNCDLVLASLGGRGNNRAGQATMALIDHFRPQFIFLVGIAGGVSGRDGTAVGDVVIPDFIDYYEMRKLIGGKSLRRCEPYDHPGFALRNQRAWPIARSGHWLRNITMPRPNADRDTPKILHGMLISGEKVLSDDNAAYQREILEYYDNALAVDMESYGLACATYASRLSRHYNPQYLVIRGVSDVLRPLPQNATENDRQAAAVSNNQERATWRNYAAHVAGAFTRSIVDHILAIPQPNE